VIDLLRNYTNMTIIMNLKQFYYIRNENILKSVKSK